MNKQELIHIGLSCIIPAPRWRVIRMLTKVWEFAMYVSTIEIVEVIEKSRNVMKSQWRIMVDGLPISWIEKDTISLGENMISFEAIEGDLEIFRGSWHFLDHSEGTEIILDAYLSVGIPGIKDFAEGYVKGLVTRNFEAILDSIERRLISTKYTSFKIGNESKIAGFGILGHFYNFKHLEKSLKMLNPTFKLPSREFLGGLFRITPSFKIYEMDEFRSGNGETTRGCFILCTFIPDMLYKDIHTVYSKVVSACKVAEKSGVGIVTLGGFASMVGERLGCKITEDVDIPITTGNTYTSALAVDGVKKAAEMIDKDIRDLTVAIVGGTGDIGSACAQALSLEAKRIIVTGRTRSNLNALYKKLKKGAKARIDATTNNKRAVEKADIIIAAANSSSSILSFDWFKPGAVICDLAYPKNLSYTDTPRKDILVFSGGLSTVPTPIDTRVDMGIPNHDVCYGCFCEVIMLSLEKRFENYSYGRGNIALEKMDEIRSIAGKHGFGLAPFFWADQQVDEELLASVRTAAHTKPSSKFIFAR